MAAPQKKKNAPVKKVTEKIKIEKYTLDFRFPALIAIVAFALYFNTLHHEYVLDDSVAITNNQFVQKGFAGISSILKVDLWHFSNLTLGYYRPLSLITFAIEQELFGKAPHISHFINILLYALTGFILCLWLMELFSGYERIFPFLVCLLFIAHPVHSEVVANLKSRDEMLSFLGIVSVLFLSLRFDGEKSKIYLIISILIFYLAMLSKETAITGLFLLPASFYFFRQKSIWESIKKTIPFIIVALIFFIQKNMIIGKVPPGMFVELNNYPYAQAKFTSSMIIFLHCLKLLFIPHPLMYDYSYNQIPAGSMTNPLTFIGLLIFVSFLFIAIRGIIRKEIWGFALVIFLTTFLPALAFVWLRGGIMAERFLYAPSLGFSIAFVFLFAKMLKLDFKKLRSKSSPTEIGKKDQNLQMNLAVKTLPKNKLIPLIVILGLTFTAYAFKTVDRNKAWKDNLTLYSTDIVNAINSTQNNRHLGNELLNKAIFEKDSIKRFTGAQKAFIYLNRAVTINPRFGEAWGDLGRYYTEIKFIPDSAIFYYHACLQATPGAAITYSNLGVVYQNIGKYALASFYYNRAFEINPNFFEAQKHAALLQQAGIDVHQYPGGEDPKYSVPGIGSTMYNPR